MDKLFTFILLALLMVFSVFAINTTNTTSNDSIVIEDTLVLNDTNSTRSSSVVDDFLISKEGYKILKKSDDFDLSKNLKKNDIQLIDDVEFELLKLAKKDKLSLKKSVDDENIDSELIDTWVLDGKTYFEISMTQDYLVWFEDVSGKVSPNEYKKGSNNNYIVVFDSVLSGVLHIGAESDQYEIYKSGNQLYLSPSGVSDDSEYHGITGNGNLTNKYLSFDGVDDYVKAGLNPIQDETSMSLSFWFRVDDNVCSGCTMHLVSNYQSTEDRFQLFLYSVDTASEGFGLYSKDSGTGLYICNSGTSHGEDYLSNGEWHNIVVTYNGGTTGKCYLDGVDTTETNQGGTFTYAGNLYLGKYGASSGSQYYFDGDMSNVLIYNDVLNNSEISLLNTSGKNAQIDITDSNLVYYDALGSFTDQSSSNNNVVANNGVVVTDNSSFKFDGTDDYIGTGVKLSEYYTISGWMNWGGDTSSQKCFICDYDATGSYSHGALRVETNGKVRAASNGLSALDSVSTISPNTWTYFALTYDGSTLKMYLNGELDNSQSGSAMFSSSRGDVGLGRGGDYNGLYFDGEVAGVAIYNDSKDATWINNTYQQGRLFNPYADSDTSFANETEGRDAISSGVSQALGSYTESTDRKVQIRLLNGNQYSATFDKVIVSGGKRYLFNYAVDEALPEFYNITPVLYVWQNANMTQSEITTSVSSFIEALN